MDISTVDLNNLLSGLLGAVVGAIIGGAISWVLAYQASREARKRDAAAKQERQRTEVFRASFKAQRILSELVSIQDQINGSIQKANDSGLADVPLWAKVIIGVGGLRPIPLETDDLIVFVEAQEFELVSELVEISMRHETICEGMKVYGDLRSRLPEFMPAVAVVEGNVVAHVGIEEDQRRAAPRLLELDTLVTDITKLLPGYIEQAKNTVTRIGPAPRKFFNDPKFPRFELRAERKDR